VITSMSLAFPGLKRTASGNFYPSNYFYPYNLYPGYASATFDGIGLDGKYLANHIYLDLTNGTYSLIGDVTNAEFSSRLIAFRAATKLTGDSAVIPGTNVFSIPGNHSATNRFPGGDSYGTFTLGSNGAISLIGHLADNTSFSQNTYVSTNFNNTNGIWPFYAALYGGKGIILGWQTNTSPARFEGWAAWSKPAKGSAYDTNAFLVLTNSYSAGYIPPARGTSYQIVFGGATLTNGLTNLLTAGSNGWFTVDADQALNLALTLTNLGSGVLSGSFSYPSGRTARSYYGVFGNPAQGGSGYFLDTNSQTGWLKITENVGP
jgi:hypothetical protein